MAAGALGLQNDSQTSNARPQAVVLTLEGAVTPTMADYLSREIEIASQAGNELVIIEIDTPGGLVDSMRKINQSILNSDTPVATYVYPSGARSASAGLYIMYAAHISAMAPATNTGAATPVQIGGAPSPNDAPQDASDEGDDQSDSQLDNQDTDEQSGGESESGEGTDTIIDAIESVRPSSQPSTPPLSNDDALREKAINDAAASIRALAELRGRNAEWAERAVREAVSVTEQEALALGVIDYVADDLDDLLEMINGTEVETPSGPKTQNTDNMLLTRVLPTALEKVLGFFANPNVAAILMSLGTTGIIIEMWNPGSVLPGVVGIISLLLGLYSFQVLPFNWLGVALIIVGIIFMGLEAYTPTFGVIGLIGLACFAAGLYIVFPDGMRVSNNIIIGSVAIAGGFLALVLFAIAGSRGGGPMLGGEAVKKREGVVDEWDGLSGHVIVEGERWRARSQTPLSPGDRIRVVDVDGLELVVRKAKAERKARQTDALPGEAS